ncbi:MAG: NADH dehydrogenase, partial [Firmicutes bacterium]|nr:NADH dehydrogenase [Bacillota bacterium]
MLIAWIVFGPLLAGLFSYILGRRSELLRDWFAVGVTAAELLLCLLLLRQPASFSVNGILAGGLHFFADGFRRTYSLIAAFMWAFTAAFAKEYFAHERENLNRYWLFMIVTLGATEGVLLSEDLMTAFVFFEILSFTSFTWVIHEETAEAIRAGYTYLFIAVIGGLVLFMGLLLLRYTAGTLRIPELQQAAAASGRPGMVLAAGVCILLGFGAKAGMFPLHVWLPKAHPAAPSPASALLSGILTKVGIYGILVTATSALAGSRPFGLLILVLGSVTMALGAVLALFSVNLKRTLACSSMSQIGFILTGVGMTVLLMAAGEEEGAGMALCGLMLHMVNHSLIKLTLFMAAGVVVMNLHALDLNAIRGWGRNKPFLKISFALGALGISGIPLFNGYISKTLLHEGIVEGIHACAGLSGLLSVLEWVFLASGGLTFAYMLKLFLCLFVEKNADPAVQKTFDGSRKAMDPLSTAVVFGSSLLMAVLGQPAVMTRLAAFMSGFSQIRSFRAFSFGNLKGSAISLGIGGLVYILVVRRLLMKQGRYVDRWPAWLDLEELFYRPVFTRFLPWLGCGLASLLDRIPSSRLIMEWIPQGVTKVFTFLDRLPDSRLVTQWIPQG